MKYVKVAMLAVLATLFVVQGALAELSFSAAFRADHDMKMTSKETSGDDVKTREQSVGGRVSFEVKGRKEAESGLYAEGVGVAHIKLDGTVGMDNARLIIGTSSWWMHLGKVDKIGTDGKGQDTYIVEAPNAPGSYNMGDVNERGVSFFMKPSDTLQFNLKLAYEGSNNLGVRPAIEVKAGSLTFKAAGEYEMNTPTDPDAENKTTMMGGGAYVEAALGTVTVGGFGSYRIAGGTDTAGDDLDDVNTLSTFAYAKLGLGAGTLGIGGGYDIKSQDNVDDVTGIRGYVSYCQEKIGGIDGLKVIVAGSGATADDGTYKGNAFGGRIRVEFSM